MTLVVSLGALILPGSLTAAGTAATTAGALGAASAGAGVGAAGGALSGALIGGTAGTAAGLSSLGAGIAGTVGAGALGAAGAGINEMVQSADAADAAAKADAARGIANQPTLAAGLAPAQAPAAAAAVPLAGIGSEKPVQGAAEGGIMMAKGGHVPLKDGAYIIPADVVSALGNGSTKAGGQFLRQLIESVKSESTKRHGLGAVHKHA
jgi:hypothetical protein